MLGNELGGTHSRLLPLLLHCINSWVLIWHFWDLNCQKLLRIYLRFSYRYPSVRFITFFSQVLFVISINNIYLFFCLFVWEPHLAVLDAYCCLLAVVSLHPLFFTSKWSFSPGVSRYKQGNLCSSVITHSRKSSSQEEKSEQRWNLFWGGQKFTFLTWNKNCIEVFTPHQEKMILFYFGPTQLLNLKRFIEMKFQILLAGCIIMILVVLGVLIMVLHSVITPGELIGSFEVPGIEPVLAMCKDMPYQLSWQSNPFPDILNPKRFSCPGFKYHFEYHHEVLKIIEGDNIQK